MWEEYRALLAANPDAIEPPHLAIAEGRVRVAVDASGRRLGFSDALGFYERVGFRVTGEVPTRFGRGIRMRDALAP